MEKAATYFEEDIFSLPFSLLRCVFLCVLFALLKSNTILHLCYDMLGAHKLKRTTKDIEQMGQRKQKIGFYFFWLFANLLDSQTYSVSKYRKRIGWRSGRKSCENEYIEASQRDEKKRSVREIPAVLHSCATLIDVLARTRSVLRGKERTREIFVTERTRAHTYEKRKIGNVHCQWIGECIDKLISIFSEFVNSFIFFEILVICALREPFRWTMCCWIVNRLNDDFCVRHKTCLTTRAKTRMWNEKKKKKLG